MTCQGPVFGQREFEAVFGTPRTQQQSAAAQTNKSQRMEFNSFIHLTGPFMRYKICGLLI
jgi:hypothetical protein